MKKARRIGRAARTTSNMGLMLDSMTIVKWTVREHPRNPGRQPHVPSARDKRFLISTSRGANAVKALLKRLANASICGVPSSAMVSRKIKRMS